MTRTEQQEDRDLVDALVRQDQAALGRLYDRYAPPVYALALRVLARPEEAQETVVDIFQQVWQQARRYDGRGSVHAWIFTIARSRAIDRLRARVRQEGHEVPLDAGTFPAAPADPAPNPEQITISSDLQRQLRQTLAGLPEAQRQAIDLAYFGGFSHTEIAARLRAPLGTVKTRIHLGLKAMRAGLAAWQGEAR